MGNEDEYDFWKSDRDTTWSGGLNRPLRGAREHGDTQRIPLVQTPITQVTATTKPSQQSPSEPSPSHLEDEFYAQPTFKRRSVGDVLSSRRETRGPADPFRARLGAICAIGLLAMPVAFAIRGNSTKSVVLAAVNITVPTTIPLLPLATTVADPTSQPVALPAAPTTAAVAVAPPTDAPTAIAEASVAAIAAETVPAMSPATQPPSATRPPTTQAVIAAPALASASPEVAAVEAKAAAVVTAPPVTTAAPASTAAPVTTAAKPVAVDVSKCAQTYAVVAGDYWIRIAKKISVSVSDLLAVNNANTNTPLFPGRTICAPANASPPTTTVSTHLPATTQPPATTAAKPPATTAPPATTSPPGTTAKPPSTTVPSPPRNTYSTAAIEQIIREVWPDDQEDEAIRIAWRESNHNPTVHNYCCYGLFQIYYSVHKTWLNAMGITSADMLYDPRVNATAAYALYQRSGGWGPWAL